MKKSPTSPESTRTPTELAENFTESLRAGVALCAEIRDAVVSILRQEETDPVWSNSRERFAVSYRQEEELEALLKTHVTLKTFNSNELPHEVKVALADLQTHKDRPIGALFRLLCETIAVAGPAVME